MFKEITLISLDDYSASETETSMSIYDKEHSLYTNSLGSSLSKNYNLQHAETTNGKVGEYDFQSYHIIIFKMSSFQQKMMRHMKE